MSSTKYEDLKLNVILLAYNEAETIESEILSWHKEVISCFANATLIVGEDGSTDGTHEILAGLHSRGVIKHDSSTHRRGYINALQSVLRMSDGDWIFFSDTGNKFRANDFWKLFNERSGCHLVSAHRYPRRDQIHRRILTYIYSLAVRSLFSEHQLRDADSGFRLYSRALLDYILSCRLTFKDFVTSEISIRATSAGFKHREIAVPYYQRSGESHGVPRKTILIKSLRAIRALLKLKKELSSQN